MLDVVLVVVEGLAGVERRVDVDELDLAKVAAAKSGSLASASRTCMASPVISRLSRWVPGGCLDRRWGCRPHAFDLFEEPHLRGAPVTRVDKRVVVRSVRRDRSAFPLSVQVSSSRPAWGVLPSRRSFPSESASCCRPSSPRRCSVRKRTASMHKGREPATQPRRAVRGGTGRQAACPERGARGACGAALMRGAFGSSAKIRPEPTDPGRRQIALLRRLMCNTRPSVDLRQGRDRTPRWASPRRVPDSGEAGIGSRRLGVAGEV